MGLFNFFIKKTEKQDSSPVPEESVKRNTITARVCGTKYRYAKDLLSLGTLNPDYLLDKRSMYQKYRGCHVAYEYIFPELHATLEFEPTNEYDSNAIKVIINGVHVGYIKRGSCSRIRNLINNDKISDITAKISGGKGKSLECECGIDERPCLSDFEFRSFSSELYISLKITLK